MSRINKTDILGLFYVLLPIIAIAAWWLLPSLKGLIKGWIALSVGLSLIGSLVSLLFGLGLLILAIIGYFFMGKRVKEDHEKRMKEYYDYMNGRR